MTGGRGRKRPEATGPASSPTPGRPIPDTDGAAPTWWEVGDALWLAAHRGVATDGGGVPPPAEASRETEPDSPPGTAADRPEADTPHSGEPPEHPRTAPIPPEPFAGAVSSGRPSRDASLLRPEPLLRDRQSLVRALQWFRRRRPSEDRLLFDETTTAESFAHRALADPRPDRARRTPILPEFTPDQEVADDLTLLIDDSLSMVVQQPLVGEFTALLAPLRVFRRIRTFYFDSDKAHVDDVMLRAATGVAPDPAHLLIGQGRDVLLVLSDGVGSGWHTGAVATWLARWGGSAAVGVAQLLDRSLWRGTGMRTRNLALTAPPGESPAPNAAHRVRPLPSGASRTAAPGPSLPEGAVAVPVFPIEAREIERWARFVSRQRGPGAFGTSALVAERTVPSPDAEDDLWSAAPALPGPGDIAPRRLDARERVEVFRVTASPPAFRLAVCLAAVPLNLVTIRLVQERFAPRSRPSELTEVLCSGLIRRSEDAHATAHGDQVALDFHPEVRELLLAAGGRRQEIKGLLETVAAHYRDALPWFGALEQLLLGEAPSADLPPVDEAVAPLARAIAPALRALPEPIRQAVRFPESFDPGDSRPPRTPPIPAHPAADSPAAAPDAADDRESREDRTVVPADSQLTSTSPETAPRSVQPALNGESAAAPGGPPEHLPRGPRTRPIVWGQVPPRNVSFVGRESQLAELAARLREGDTAVLPHQAPAHGRQPSSGPVPPQTLQGMGGVGKTQLAMEFAWRHRGDYELVWWVPSDSRSQIQQSLIELGTKLGLGTGADPATMVRAVLEALRSGDPYRDWLLIYDNAADPADVRPLIPTGGPGQVLVTTRSPQWRVVSGNLVRIDTFERHESRQLLLRRGPEGLTAADADRIAEKLGDLPLAVEQTAVWLYETLMPAEEWLAHFDEKADELLSNVSPSPDYPWSVAATMNMTLDRLRETNPGALQLLQVCAFLAPRPIPRRLFNGTRHAEAPPELAEILADPAIKLGRALRAIDRYALARMDHRNSTFQLHRLVQETLKLPLSADERTALRHCAHLLLADLDPGDPLSAQDWPRYVELLPHVWETEQWDCQSPWARELVLSEIRFLDLWGSPSEAEALGRRALDLWAAKLGAEHPHTLRTSMRYALILSSLGRFTESYDRSTALVETLTRLRGSDDEETLEARLSLALDLRNLGRFRHAVEVSREVLEQQQRLFGRDDPLTLQTAHVHAIGLRLTGEFTTAMEIDRYNHERRIAMFGPEHAYTLSSKYGFALGLMESGRYWESMQALDELHADNTRLYPMRSPLRLITMLALSTVKRRTGRLREALALSEEACRLFEEHLGPEAQGTVRAAASHAVSLRAIGEHDAALALSEESRDRYRSIFGDEHPLYADVSLNHAVTLRLLGRVEEARAVDEEAMRVHVDRLGDDHPATLANAVNLASDLIAGGDARSALDLDLRTHERAVRVFGENHPLTLAALRNTNLDRRIVENAPLDEERADVVMRYRAMFGPDHPATRSAAQDIRANCDLFMNGM